MFTDPEKRNNGNIDRPCGIRFSIIPLVAGRIVQREWIQAVMTNPESEGLSFSCDKYVETGSFLDLRIDIPGIAESSNAIAEIVHVEREQLSPLFCITIKFKKIDTGEKERINTFMQKMVKTKRLGLLNSLKNQLTSLSELLFYYRRILFTRK